MAIGRTLLRFCGATPLSQNAYTLLLTIDLTVRTRRGVSSLAIYVKDLILEITSNFLKFLVPVNHLDPIISLIILGIEYPLDQAGCRACGESLRISA